MKLFCYLRRKQNVSLNLVLHPHAIAPIFLKLDSWAPEAAFIIITSTKEINQIKNGKFEEIS